MKTLKPNFFLDIQRKNSEGLAPIRVRSRHNSSTLIVKSTGLFCAPSSWDKKKSLPKKDLVLEAKVDALKLSIKNSYKELSAAGPGVTLADVWEALYPSGRSVTKAPATDKVTEWIDYYLQHSPYSAEYIRGAKHLKVHLTGKSKKGKVKAFNPSLRFKDLNQSTIDSFCKHMATQGKSTGSVVKIIKFLRQIAKLARDHNVKVPSTDFKTPRNYKKKVRTEIRMTFEELVKLREVKLYDAREVQIRDMFLFMCYSGMRHSDAIKITPADNHGDFLLFMQEKTDDQVAVTLHQYSKPILKKYSEGKRETDLIFPEHTQQKFNEVIKTIARKAGLNDYIKVSTYSGTEEHQEEIRKYKLIKSHTGRRTCSRILALLSVPEEIIAEELGHNGRTITRHYIGNSDHVARIKTVQGAWNNAQGIFEHKALMRAV